MTFPGPSYAFQTKPSLAIDFFFEKLTKNFFNCLSLGLDTFESAENDLK